MNILKPFLQALHTLFVLQSVHLPSVYHLLCWWLALCSLSVRMSVLPCIGSSSLCSLRSAQMVSRRLVWWQPCLILYILAPVAAIIIAFSIVLGVWRYAYIGHAPASSSLTLSPSLTAVWYHTGQEELVCDGNYKYNGILMWYAVLVICSHIQDWPSSRDTSILCHFQVWDRHSAWGPNDNIFSWLLSCCEFMQTCNHSIPRPLLSILFVL